MPTDIYTEAAEQIEKALFIHRRQFSDDISDIAAILREEYPNYEEMREAVHGLLDENCMCLDPEMPAYKQTFTVKADDWAWQKEISAARLVNRCIDNGDGTVTITERKDNPPQGRME